MSASESTGSSGGSVKGLKKDLAFLLSSLESYVANETVWSKVPALEKKARVAACIQHLGSFGEWLANFELQDAAPFLFLDDITSFRTLHHQFYHHHGEERPNRTYWTRIPVEIREGLRTQLFSLGLFSCSLDENGVPRSTSNWIPTMPAPKDPQVASSAFALKMLEHENEALTSLVTQAIERRQQINLTDIVNLSVEAHNIAASHYRSRLVEEKSRIERDLESGSADSSDRQLSNDRVKQAGETINNFETFLPLRLADLKRQIGDATTTDRVPELFSFYWHPGSFKPAWNALKRALNPEKPEIAKKEAIPTAKAGVTTTLTSVTTKEVKVAPTHPPDAVCFDDHVDILESGYSNAIAASKPAQTKFQFGVPATVDSASDLINSMSGGMARRGIPIGMPAHLWKHPPRLPILSRLTTAEFGPSQHRHSFRDEQFCNQEESSAYSSIVQNSGWSLSLSATTMGITAKRSHVDTELEKRLVLQRLQYVPVMSFFIEQNASLSNKLWKRALKVRNLTKAQEFLEDFYAFISTGIHHVGGIHSQTVEVVSENTATQFTMKEIAVNHFSGSLGFSPTTATSSSSSSARLSTSVQRFVIKGGVESHGVVATDPDDYITQLAANPSQWFLIDRGDLENFVPVWDLLLKAIKTRNVTGTDAEKIRKCAQLLLVKWLEMVNRAHIKGTEPRFWALVRQAERTLRRLNRKIGEFAQEVPLLQSAVYEGTGAQPWNINVTNLLNSIINREKRLVLPLSWTSLFGEFLNAGILKLTLTFADDETHELEQLEYSGRRRFIHPDEATDQEPRDVALFCPSVLILSPLHYKPAFAIIPEEIFGVTELTLQTMSSHGCTNATHKFVLSWTAGNSNGISSTAQLLFCISEHKQEKWMARKFSRLVKRDANATHCFAECRLPSKFHSSESTNFSMFVRVVSNNILPPMTFRFPVALSYPTVQV